MQFRGQHGLARSCSQNQSFNLSVQIVALSANKIESLEVSPVGDVQIPFHIYHKSLNPRKIQDGTEVKSNDRKFLSHSREAGNMQHGSNWHMFKFISPLRNNHGGKSQAPSWTI